MFVEIWELSDPPHTVPQLKCSQTRKRSKKIGKTVDVTSVTQLQFCDAGYIDYVLGKAYGCLIALSKMAEDGNTGRRIVK